MGLAIVAPVLPVAPVVAGPPGASRSPRQQAVRTVFRGPPARRTIALTFDDGWSADRCLDIANTLDRYDIPATFFLNGVYMYRDRAAWRSIAARFPIGNHTYNHRDLRQLDERGITREIERNRRVIESVTGRKMAPLLRPPYGSTDARVNRIAARLGYTSIVLWDTTSGDTGQRSTARGVAKAALAGGSGSIVLMHCGPAVTPSILPTVIERYACAGYRFVTVEELFAGSSGHRAQVTCPPLELPAKTHPRRPTGTDGPEKTARPTKRPRPTSEPIPAATPEPTPAATRSPLPAPSASPAAGASPAPVASAGPDRSTSPSVSPPPSPTGQPMQGRSLVARAMGFVRHAVTQLVDDAAAMVASVRDAPPA